MASGASSPGVWRRLWRDWIKPAAIIVVIAVPVKSSIVDWNWVPTGSMKPTILEGDVVLVNKVAYDLKVPFTLSRLKSWGDPGRGDIVVFHSPQDETRLVKRVVAGPGDVIEMRNRALIINGKPLSYSSVPIGPEHEIYEDKKAVLAREQDGSRARLIMAMPSYKAMVNLPPTKIPSGQYFVMGDSRDNSYDSRYIGLIDRKAIIGRATRVLLSLNRNESYSPRVDRFFSRLDRM